MLKSSFATHVGWKATVHPHTHTHMCVWTWLRSSWVIPAGRGRGRVSLKPCFPRDPLRSFVPCLFCYIVLPEHVRSSHSPGCGEGYSLVENHFFGSPYLSCLSPHFFLLHLISFLCPYLSSLSARRRSLASSLRLVGRFTTPRRTKPLTSHQSMVHFFLPSDILCSTHLHTSLTKN